MDLKRLTDILDIIDARGIAELELEEGGTRIRVRKALEAPAAPVVAAPPLVAAVAPAAAPAPSAPPASVPAPAPAEEADETGTVVASPIVGTFYRAPDPNSPPFVNVGDRVRVGQVLCIIEAMKLMNEIEAEVAGVVTKIHQENGQPVQYGAPLFSIRQER